MSQIPMPTAPGQIPMGVLRDGFTNLEGGIDSGRAPNLVRPNQCSFAVNTTFRGGFPKQRPGFTNIPINLSKNTCDDFTANKFQAGIVYEADDGTAFMVLRIGGKLYSLRPDGTAKNIDIPNDPNPDPPLFEQGWLCQAENYLIAQDGQSMPKIFDGSTTRRADPTVPEAPVGTAMVYGFDRLLVCKGRQYVAGDALGDPSGNQSLNFRDAVIKFTENTLIAQGGAFSVPMTSGEIRAMAMQAAVNTALGQSNIVVSTQNAVFTTVLPADRTTWQNTTSPLQTIAQIAKGFAGPVNFCNVNGDIWYRGPDGWRSLVMAVRNFNYGWGNTPLSREMNRVLAFDTPSLLQFGSMVYFDNRLLCAVSPATSPQGVYHRGIGVLDFDVLSSMNNVKGMDFYSGFALMTQPSWEGVWTNIFPLQLLAGNFSGEDRCFAICLNTTTSRIELWEISATDPLNPSNNQNFDLPDGVTDTPIDWWFETRSCVFNDPFQLKELVTGEITLDQVLGNVTVNVSFRPDLYPFWYQWDNWTECVNYKDCPPSCSTPTYNPQYRPKHGLIEPGEDFVPGINRPLRRGYEFQTRIEVTGAARLKQFRMSAFDVQENIRGDLPDNNTSTPIACSGLTGCDEPIFPAAPMQGQPTT